MRVLVVVAIGLLAACGDGAPSGVCKDGETRPCYAGPAGTRGIGACTDGIETCSAGAWQGICVGDKPPFVESCNDADDDCNGMVDDVEDAGVTCNGSNGCDGHKACIGTKLGCIADPQNECGVCDGPTIEGLGNDCVANECPGSLVCTSDGTGTQCNAPVQNACGVCGGPTVNNLGDVCTATAGCAGQRACNSGGTAAICDCSVNICNDNGTIRPVRSPEPGDLVITEMMPSPSKVSDTVGEWFEVKAIVDVDLNNLLLDRVNDSNAPNAVNAYDCIHLTAGSYAVFARNATSTTNGGITGVVDTFTFSLVSGSVASPGDIQILAPSGTLLDSVAWTSSRTGKSLQLDPDATDPVSNDQSANYCDGATAYGDGDLGTPGNPNAQCASAVPPGQCDTGTSVRPIVKPGATDLVITEVMANPKIEPAQEWFEITNVGSAAFDLNGLGLDRAADNSLPSVVGTTLCKSLDPGTFALFARNATSGQNGMLPVPDATFSFSLVNSDGDVRVVDPTTCSGSPIVCTTIYDSVSYTTVPADGVSSEVKPTFFTTTGNDDPANYCTTTNTYGDNTNRGTPRAANVCN